MGKQCQNNNNNNKMALPVSQLTFLLTMLPERLSHVLQKNKSFFSGRRKEGRREGGVGWFACFVI